MRLTASRCKVPPQVPRSVRDVLCGAFFVGRSLWEAARPATTSIAGNATPGCPSGDAKSFGELGHGVVVQLVVFEEPLSLFAHGNTSPGHGWPPLRGKRYPCPYKMCHLCP